MDLSAFAAAVGDTDPVCIAGLGTRGGSACDDRLVAAPSGVYNVEADEMIVDCGAGTPVAELQNELRAIGQFVALPDGGTVGGALAVGRSGVRRLGDGPVRDALLQANFINAAGKEIKAGGPTVKNVSGFDLCRLLVGSRGTLGFLGTVRLRTRPLAAASRWFSATTDPWDLQTRLYRPTSVLWDGATTWVLLEGHPDDVLDQAEGADLSPCGGAPMLPTGGRWSLSPGSLASLRGEFVAEIGVGVVHHSLPAPVASISDGVRRINERLKQHFDPTGRLNPGVSLFDV